MTVPNHDKDIVRLLASTGAPTAAELAELRARLTDRAEEAGLLDVAYRMLDTAVGTLLIAATRAGLVRVAYEREGLDRVLETLAAKVSPRILAAPRRLDTAARQLDEYFAHQRRHFDLPVDLALASGFRRQVLTYLPAIDYGQTASYASVAAAVNNPKAVRAVGSACATNPLPLVIPCHRVVRSDGGTGEYVGGADAKRRLLDLEAA
ncbi:MAG TPA: methylated-DNA--[protein]-cysteine S-methyltransferase [Acidimicrobiales bacterium]